MNQFRSAVRVAQACNPLMVQRDKVKDKMVKLANEYREYDAQIQSLEAGIVNVIGLRVEDLVKKVVEPGIDANGNPKKTTKYVKTDRVSYDDVKKQYVITLPDLPQEQAEEAPAEREPERVF